VRDYAARTLDPLVGQSGFDFILDSAPRSPCAHRMLLGIPRRTSRRSATADEGSAGRGVMPEVDFGQASGSTRIRAYIDWRVEHPSDAS